MHSAAMVASGEWMGCAEDLSAWCVRGKEYVLVFAEGPGVSSINPLKTDGPELAPALFWNVNFDGSAEQGFLHWICIATWFADQTGRWTGVQHLMHGASHSFFCRICCCLLHKMILEDWRTKWVWDFIISNQVRFLFCFVWVWVWFGLFSWEGPGEG